MSYESEQSKYKLNIDQFLHRFRNSNKLDDLFSRGYTICLDSYTNERTILKFYSIETADQEQAVLENILNFTKLNRIQGISKLVAYAVAESGSELISAFEYHPITLGEYVKLIKNENIKEYDRLQVYLDLVQEITKIIVMGVEIGIQMDDINRQTIIVKQNPFTNQVTKSTSSIFGETSHILSIFYDERQKEYNTIEQKKGHTNNKIYWTAEKIESQALRGIEYSTQQGQEPIYQLGLMMIDIIYEIESHYYGKKNSLGELKPDQVALHSQNPLSYYVIDRQSKEVTRNQILVSHRLNYLLNSENELIKQVTLSLKSMIVPMAEARPDLNKIIISFKTLQQILKKNYESRLETPMKSLQNNGQSLKSIESMAEQRIHMSIADTIRNDEDTKPTEPIIHIDSLKYSENSFPNQQRDNLFKRNNSSPSPIPYRKQGNNPLSATTITSDVTSKMIHGMSGYESNKNTFHQQSTQDFPVSSQPFNQQASINQILENCKHHYEGLRKLLLDVLQQIQSLQRTVPNSVTRKEFLDQSIYYGCIDQNSKRDGLGVYMYKTGDVYFGIWKQNILTTGTYLFRNGESFQGIVKNGKQGSGIYRYSNGNVYDGFWKDDLKNGQGKMSYPSGAKYQGQWLKGKKHGQGIYYYENGTQYRGGFALGKKFGNGVFLFPNGTKVQGFWDNNHLEGLAKIYYHNGDYYEGNLHMSQKNGQGIYRWNNLEEGQIQYKGEFSKDNLDGYAIIKFKNGQIYEGKVRNGKRDGQGTYKYMNGDEFKGEWKNDHKQIGKYTFSTGDEFEGKFKQGQMSYGLLKYQNGEIYQGEFYQGERSGVGTYSNKVGQIVYEGRWEKDEYIGVNKY